MSLSPYCLPVVRCRCCGQPVAAKYQPGLGQRAGYHLLTCLNEACLLRYFTFGSPDYADVDLTPYLESGRARQR